MGNTGRYHITPHGNLSQSNLLIIGIIDIGWLNFIFVFAGIFIILSLYYGVCSVSS